MYSCWPLSTNAAAADMLSRLSERLGKLVCGLSPPATSTDGVDGEPRTCGLSSSLLFSPGRGQSDELRRSWSHPNVLVASTTAITEEPRTGERDDEEEMAEPRRAAALGAEEDGEAALPCLAFASGDGYRVLSLAENRMRDDSDVAMRLARGRRHVPSPYGGKVFATDMCGRHPSHPVDPFTGERTPLPDLPVPLSEEEPMPFVAGDEPQWRLSTDDGFAWDWSPRGVMVARGDTVFFCEAGSGGGKWTPVHRSRHGSAMTVNYRDGFFFVLELRSLRTTVIDAETLGRSAEIDPPPRCNDIDKAFLVASTDDVLLLVRRTAGDDYSGRAVLSQAYRARHRQQQQQQRPPRWEPVTDIGDRAAFVDRAHGFTVRAGERVRRNCVYMAVRMELEEEEPFHRGVSVHGVGVAPLSNLKKMAAADEGSELSRCKVQTMWGPAHWIICNHGSSSSRGPIVAIM